MSNATTTTRTRSFTASDGSEVIVYTENEIERRADGWTARGRAIRTYAVNEGCEFDMEPGHAYQAERIIEAAIEAAESAYADAQIRRY